MSEGFVEVSYKPGQEFTIRLNTPRLSGTGSEALRHLLSANKELLLALRSIIDAAVQVAEAPGKKAEGEGKKRIKVE